MIDAPRWSGTLECWIAEGGGLHHILLTHRDDVADAERYAQRFGARVWIHEADAGGARFATDLMSGDVAHELLPGVRAIPVPGHTKGSVMYLIGQSLFSGDSLAWDHRSQALQAWRDVCWYDWPTQIRSLERLTDETFAGLFAGHGGSTVLTAAAMRRALHAFLDHVDRE
jgi:glyoxylase-like metal-dependent hydrolase (beta-lactamase superfamily II)